MNRDEWAVSDKSEYQRKTQLAQLDMILHPEKYQERARNWMKNSLRRTSDARAHHREELAFILKELNYPNCAVCKRPLTVDTLAACVDLLHDPDECGLTFLDSCEMCVFRHGATVRPIDEERFGSVSFSGGE